MKKFTLPKEFGENWINALRSGKFKKGNRKYYDESTDCYCAMGVGYKVNGGTFEMGGSYISKDTKRMFLSSGGDNELWFPIQNMNDNDNMSFNQIADWIEQNVTFN